MPNRPSGLPQQILPQGTPLGTVIGDKIIIDQNWWLFFYNIANQTLAPAGSNAPVPIPPATSIVMSDDDKDDALVAGLPRQITNAWLDSLFEAQMPPLPGPIGPAGAPGQIVYMEAPEADEPMFVPGAAGSAGSTGPPGPAGFALDGEEGPEGLAIPGPQGPQGSQGSTGPAGSQGFGLDGIDGEEGMPIPGPQGPAGSVGATGPAGAVAASIAFDGDEGPEGMPIPGPVGPQGSTGAGGPAGPAVYLEAPDADEPMVIPGPPGAAGSAGSTGAGGPAGPAVYLEAPEADEPMVLPGPAGAAGIAGSTGAQGPTGPAVYLEAPEADEPIMFPGIPGSPAPILGFSGGLTASTTINDTTTPTTGGVTLASQVAVTGSVWRIRAHGTFVAVSSGTARNAVAAVFWGSTQLTPTISTAVLASTAQTTNWEMEFIVTASSTTAVWATGYRNDQIGATATFSLKNATPASTTVTAGAQTIDLRFSMSAAVATDQWVVQNVTIERLK